eukprot:7391320-Prymnesium_polylepis.2
MLISAASWWTRRAQKIRRAPQKEPSASSAHATHRQRARTDSVCHGPRARPLSSQPITLPINKLKPINQSGPSSTGADENGCEPPAGRDTPRLGYNEPGALQRNPGEPETGGEGRVVLASRLFFGKLVDNPGRH